jgi:hypothetical protein
MRSTSERSRAGVAIWTAFRLGLTAITALALGTAVLPFQQTLADETAFRDGHADRQA